METADRLIIPVWVFTIALLVFSLLVGVIWHLINKTNYHFALWVGWGAAVLLVTIIAFFIRNDFLKKEIKVKQPIYAGFLLPANDPGPQIPKGGSNDTIQLLLGDDLRVLAVKSRTQVLSLRGDPFLTIGIKDDIMTLGASIVDVQNLNIVRIIDNEFKVSSENAFNPKQPDKHSLIVRDLDGNEVLNLRFMNRKTIRIVGRFHLEGHTEPLIIHPQDGIIWPGGGGISHLTLDMTQSSGGVLNFQ